jgi:hypothetical protein
MTGLRSWQPAPRGVLLGVTGIVVLAVAAAGLTEPSRHASNPAGRGSGASVRPVTAATLVCAAVPGRTANSSSTLAAGSPAAVTGGAGTLTLTTLSAAPARPLARVDGRSQLRYVPGRGPTRPLVLRATGAMARGLTGTVTTRTAAGPARGLQTSTCVEPSGDWWFVGGGASVGRRSVLYLADADSAPALVDVTVYTTGRPTASPVLPPQAQGLTVQPDTQVALAVDAMAPAAGEVTIHVHARAGRVAAAVSDSQVTGLTPGGVDWVPPSVPPSHSVVVVGLPGDAQSSRQLALLVPGVNDAQVKVLFATPQGTLSPGAFNSLSVPAGQVTLLDLTRSGVSGVYSVVVESDQPLVAGVRTARGDRGQLREFSYATGAAPVTGGAVVLPFAWFGDGVRTVLQLTGPPDTDVFAEVSTLAVGGPAPQRVRVPAGQTVQVAVGWTAAPPALVQTTGGLPLTVGWVIEEAGSRGPLLTGGWLPQTPVVTTLPPVEADPAVGFPGH